MIGYGEVGFIFMTLFYLAIVVFLFWMVFRFVKAHESIAESLRRIADKGKEEFKKNTIF